MSFCLPTTPYYQIDNASQRWSQMSLLEQNLHPQTVSYNVFSKIWPKILLNQPPHLLSFQTSPVLRMMFFTCCLPFPWKHHLALMVFLVPCFGIQPQPSPPPSSSCLINPCHMGRSLQDGNFQISHLYQKVVTPILSQIIAPYCSCHCHQQFLNVLSSTSFYLIYLQIPFSQTPSLASVLVAPPRRPSFLPQPAGINIWMRSTLSSMGGGWRSLENNRNLVIGCLNESFTHAANELMSLWRLATSEV